MIRTSRPRRSWPGSWAGCRWRWSRPPPTSRPAGINLAGYLALFRDRRADLLARGQPAGHPADVAATLGLALSRLGDEAPAAAGLLRLLAFLAPEPVPLALLLADAPARWRAGPRRGGHGRAVAG